MMLTYIFIVCLCLGAVVTAPLPGTEPSNGFTDTKPSTAAGYANLDRGEKAGDASEKDDLSTSEYFYPGYGGWWGVRPIWGGWSIFRPGWGGWRRWHRPTWGGNWGHWSTYNLQ